MQPYMLDTNTLSYVCKGSSPVARARLEQMRRHAAPCLSSITEAEMLYGMRKRQVSTKLVTEVEGFLSTLTVLDWGRREASVYAQLRTRQELLGKPLANLDMLIAAHAIATGSVLVTNDKAFGLVQELTTENWATDL